MTSPSVPLAVFLDSGGVINDNRQRASQWLKHLGDFLPTTVLGGTPETWASANALVMKSFFKDWQEHMQTTADMVAASTTTTTTTTTTTITTIGATTWNQHANVATVFDRSYRLRWIQEMCVAAAGAIPDMQVVKKQLLGQSCQSGYEARWHPYQVFLQGQQQPLTDDFLVDLATQTHLYVLERVQAAYPGAVTTILGLKGHGAATSFGSLRLFTSSGDSSKDLEVILRGLGQDVLECFDGLYGADVVNCLKNSPAYYERVFAHAKVDPSRVLVLDDNERALGWAKESGAATTVLVAGDGAEEEDEGEIYRMADKDSRVDYRISSLSKLPALLAFLQDLDTSYRVTG